jgi:hypothetical protein
MGLGTYHYCVCLTAAQHATLLAAVAQSQAWTYTNTCASFASEIFEEVTGIDVDADEFAGLETPREIGESIVEKNGGTATPSGTPPPAPGPTGSSSSGP